MNEKQMDRLDSEAREQRAASKLAPCELRATEARCSVADGSKAVSSAEVLWVARDLALTPSDDPRGAAAEYCSEILRRHAASVDSAPAASNIRDEPRPLGAVVSSVWFASFR